MLSPRPKLILGSPCNSPSARPGGLRSAVWYEYWALERSMALCGLDVVAVDLAVQRGGVDPQDLRRPRLVALRLGQHPLDVGLLDRFHRRRRGGHVADERGLGLFADLLGQVPDIDLLA